MRLTFRILSWVMWLAVGIGLALLWQIVDQSYLPPAGDARNVRFEYIELPELVACGENGAYRCMSDEDYMQMVVFGQFVRHLYEDPHRPLCEKPGCVCAMSEEYKR